MAFMGLATKLRDLFVTTLYFFKSSSLELV